MSVLGAFDASVSAAIADGSLDEVKQGAVIAAARKVALMFDEPEWPIVKGKLDNVSPSVFLKYCDALGLMPDAIVESKSNGKKLAVMIEGGKFSKAANG